MPSAPTKIVFLIDEQSLIKHHISLDRLKLCIMRTLLFYHSQQLEVRWGFRFFSTKIKYTADSIRRFYTMSEEHLDAMEREYKKREKSRPKETTALTAPIVKIKQLLREAIGDFQWEYTDLCTVTPATKNYIYILTACPGNLQQINLFFVSPNLDQDEMMDLESSSPPSVYPPQFQEAKENLAEFAKIYQERNISINIVDTDSKCPPSNPHEQLVSRIIKKGFQSLFGQFDGTYISFDTLTASYNIYGHSFISEFANILPCATTTTTIKKKCQVPAWKGPFKTKQGKSIGNFVLYPCLKNVYYQSNSLAYISEIRTVNVIHASQFPTSWLLNDSSTAQDYKLTYEEGESPKLLNIVLDELYAMQSILIAELIPLHGYEQLARKVSIEPFSRSSASLRFLSIQHVPNMTRLKHVKVDEDYPVGNYITGTHLGFDLPREIPSFTQQYKVNLDAPVDIKKRLQGRKAELIKDKKGKMSIKSSVSQKQPVEEEEQVVEKVIQLPADVNMMAKELKKLYLDLLYTQNDTVENALVIIDGWINHLLEKDYTKMDIISTLFNYTMPYEDLDMKHNNEIPQAAHQKPSGQSTLEQAYLYEWWRSVKARGASDPGFEKKSCTVLKVKEARLQVMLYCFITRLVVDLPAGAIKRDPCEQAERFFKRIVILYSYHDINEFLTELDSEDGPEAINRRDPADMNDFAFMSLLEKRFNDLSDLTTNFKETVGGDEMTSSPASHASMNEDFNVDENMFRLDPPSPVEKVQRPIQSFFHAQSDKPAATTSTSRRPPSDGNIRKTGSPMKLKPSKPPSTSSSSRPPTTTSSSKPKALLPIKMQRTNSQTPLDQFMKRQVDVKSSSTTNASESRKSEATQAAIAKMNRSTVNGRPTMKRLGSFTKGAQSPKRSKRSGSILSHGETSTVVLRKETRNQGDPELTPRTSMNRFLDANIFSDYSELAMSPSKTAQAAAEEAAEEQENRSSSQYLASHYPAIPKTPQGTPHRYRKAMLGHHRTAHDEEVEEEDEEDEFSVLKSDEHQATTTVRKPPYTPRTAAKRQRDRIERSNVAALGTNLTSKFQNLLEEEKQKPAAVRKTGYSIFDDDEEEEGEKDEEEEDYFNTSKRRRNENINPFVQGGSATAMMTRPVVLKKNKSKIDSLFDEEDSGDDESF